ncbi:MAG: STAS domain-containing protein [Candidatus Omnitrophota bacterium]
MGSLLKHESRNGINIIRLYFSEITLQESESIKEQLSDLVLPENKKFIIDLSKVGFVSSLVVGIMLFFFKKVEANGGQLKICGLSPEAFTVFQITKTDTIISLYPTEAEAIENFTP